MKECFIWRCCVWPYLTYLSITSSHVFQYLKVIQACLQGLLIYVQFAQLLKNPHNQFNISHSDKIKRINALIILINQAKQPLVILHNNLKGSNRLLQKNIRYALHRLHKNTLGNFKRTMEATSDLNCIR